LSLLRAFLPEGLALYGSASMAQTFTGIGSNGFRHNVHAAKREHKAEWKKLRATG